MKHLIAILAATTALSGAVQAQEIKEFNIGILGGENAQDRLTSNECYRAAIEASLGVPVKVFTPADYDGVIQGLLGGTLDMAWLGASAFAKIHLTDPNAVELKLTKQNIDGSTGYYSIGFARADSGITSIEDAKGKSVRLTPVGKNLARLPIEPRFARMLLEAKTQNLVREVLIIVAGLTIQDPRERPLAKRPQADQMHMRFADPTSDFLSLLNLWNYLEEQQQKLSSSAFRRLCRSEFLNYLRVREWQDLMRQLRSVAKPLGIIPGNAKVDPDGIHKCLLSGMLSQIGLRQLSEKKGADLAKSGKPAANKGPGEYLGSNGKKFVIFPGSTMAKKPTAAIMTAELVETSRLFARMNAAIDPAWAEPLAGDLCKRSFSEPHWEKTQGSVVAYERVMLFGVPIVVSRRMQYSRIDAELCRELFVRHALVQGEWDSKQPFDRANRALMKQLEADFHESFITVYGNEQVSLIYARLLQKMYLFRLHNLDAVGPANTLQSMREHLAVIDALEAGNTDAAIAQNDAQRAAFWKVREEQSAAQKPEGGGWKHDVSVPISRIAEFIDEASAAVDDGAVVVAWARRQTAGRDQWLRWQSPPLRTRAQWREAWNQGAQWGRNPSDDQRRRETVLLPLDQWRLYYYRDNAWSNPQSSDAAGSSAADNANAAAAASGRALATVDRRTFREQKPAPIARSAPVAANTANPAASSQRMSW